MPDSSEALSGVIKNSAEAACSGKVCLKPVDVIGVGHGPVM